MVSKKIILLIFPLLIFKMNAFAAPNTNRLSLGTYIQNHTESESVAFIKSFLEHFEKINIDLEDTMENGDTPLIVASRLGYPRVILQLVHSNVNLHHKNAKGNTALITAAAYGKTGVVRILLSHGAKLEDQSLKGNTALVLAAESGHFDTVRALLDAGANLNHQTFRKNTALMRAPYGYALQPWSRSIYINIAF